METQVLLEGHNEAQAPDVYVTVNEKGETKVTIGDRVLEEGKDYVLHEGGITFAEKSQGRVIMRYPKADCPFEFEELVLKKRPKRKKKKPVDKRKAQKKARRRNRK